MTKAADISTRINASTAPDHGCGIISETGCGIIPESGCGIIGIGTYAARALVELACLLTACLCLDLLVDRSLAEAKIGFATWLVLAVGQLASVYGSFLLLCWALLRIWNRCRLLEAHRAAAAVTLVLAVISKGLLVYSIGSGFSNA